jgi:hypothetical protein
MASRLVTSLLVGILAQQGSAAVCNSNLMIDDFSKWSSKTNSLGQWASGG